MKPPLNSKRLSKARAIFAGFTAAVLVFAGWVRADAATQLSDKFIPFDSSITQQPEPPIQFGQPFVETGPLTKPIELPTGAIWQPNLMTFGWVRSAFQTYDDGRHPRVSEWANQVSLFGNLQLSGSERVVIAFRPFDNYRHYFSQGFEPNLRFHDFEYSDFTEAFFEGDFNQLFPKLDPNDRYGLDYGFSVGRQPLLLQDGLLLDDTIDSVGIIRNQISSTWFSLCRVTFLAGWRGIHRGNNDTDNSARMFALEFSGDHYALGTIDFDAVYILAKPQTGSGLFGGTGITNRVKFLGRAFNFTGRLEGSYAVNRSTPQTSSGALFVGEVSRTPDLSGNFAYLNTYLGIGEFSSAARRPDTGGPLGRVGILYDAVGLGKYRSAMSQIPANSGGAAVGYQMFFDNTRRQLIVEAGGRVGTHLGAQTAMSIGSRLQQAIGKHIILQFDTFVTGHDHASVGYGGRTEVMFKF